ncbi:MAG: hypothetical protein A2W90_04170 [Bacteroidetes bacterium GWF2_42_66]|nr:MAG: hypothetical protein A2W92_06985 [Bacteroidetes bacterium GWA2_42_15]OFY02484.1 MAG: hypothetical protein A2W89_21685 [Bacteroidetes bacterium GWE2_42_39]OFY41418.1 MAG: hypothetical protein A2W90_04170 [Bacteroidetes bacterium GWF2_42_66]HBL75377.1 hypothetical protein [Prolixibacteraceae bacterium]HCR90297.1 hypothetical protein [Prolixibacteraceae bacterium]
MPISDNVSMFYGAKPHIFEKAKMLRKQMTKAELIVWEILKGKKMLDCRFRPQHPIDIFIADFYCHSLKLVIEIDGGIHKPREQREYDIGREAEMERWGLKFLRFTNEEVEDNIEDVKHRIIKECGQRKIALLNV